MAGRGRSRQAFTKKKDQSKCAEAGKQSMRWGNMEHKGHEEGRGGGTIHGEGLECGAAANYSFPGDLFGPTSRQG